MEQRIKPKLKLDWCSYKMAKYACENWHYSRTIPIGKIVKIGVWENNKFIGCVLYSRGTAKDLGKKYNLEQTECIELTRVALTKHLSSVTKIISISIKVLKNYCNGIKLIVSFADLDKGHIGSIIKVFNAT